MAQTIKVKGFSRRGFRVSSNKRANYLTSALVDLDNQQDQRILATKNGTFYSPSEFPLTLQKAGAVATATTASGLVLRAHKDLTITHVLATVGTAPASQSLIVDVHKIADTGAATDAGTTIFTTQSRRPTIAAAATVSTLDATNGVPQVTAWNKGEFLRVEVDQVGTGTTGSDLRVLIYCE